MSPKKRTGFGRLWSLCMALFGLSKDIFEILRVLAIWGTKNFQNRTIFDRATDQNVKVYQKSFWQNWLFSKAQKSWTALEINKIQANSIDQGVIWKLTLKIFIWFKIILKFFIISVTKSLKTIEKTLNKSKNKNIY